MRTRSVKRAKQEKQYKRVRDMFLAMYPICQCCDNWPSSAVHHKKGRIGELLTNEEYFLAVCNECHHEIEMNPKWAKEHGYSLSRLSKEVSELKKV